MKNKKNILKYQFSGVMQDATTVKKPDRQIVVKNNNDNWKQLVAKNQPKQQTRLFELTPEIKKDIEEHTKKGDVQLTNGEWITKEEYNKLKAKKSTGAINPDYSDPLTMGITMAAAPAQGLLKAASSKIAPKLNTVGKVIREGVDMIDPTSIGMFGKKFKSEINWANWNPDTPKYPELIKEYDKIEKTTKANGTWMKNSDGSPFRGKPEQFVQQQSSYFKKAFGDSKTVNPDGSYEPVVHSTKAKFDEFDKSYFGETDEGYHGKGFYFSPIQRTGFEGEFYQRPYKWIDDKTVQGTHNYGKNKMMLYIKPDKIEGEFPVKPYTELIVDLDKPGNIKSAIGNVGFFDTKNPNIYKSLLPALVGTGLSVKAASNQESKKQGGLFKDGGKIDCGCNIDKDEIDTDVLFDLPQQIFDLLGKSIGLKKGTKYDNKVKDKLKEDAKLNNMNLRDYLMKNPDVSKHITIIEMKRQGGLLGYQTGGLVSNITNSQNVNNKTNEVVMQYNIKQPVVKELQQGGQLDEKQFIQWLAQQLGATDENDFKQKVQKLGKGGIEKAKQMFMQQSQKMEQGGYLPRYKRGGIFKYQNAGVFRSFADTENRSVNNITEDPQKGTKKSSYTFIPGTYDVESKIANTYNNINSSQQFDAGTTNAQSKIDYSKGVGQRTQSGLQGNRGKQGINLTDRLASERQDVQNTFEKVYNTPEFTKRMYKAKDGNTYLLDTTGKYVIGKLDQKEETVPPTPTSANPKINRPVRFGLVVADNKEMADGKVAKGTLTFELGTDKENKEYLRQADPKTANSLLMLNSADNPYDTGKHTSFNDGQNERAFYQKQLEDLMKDENSELRKLLKSYQNKATATEQEVLEKPKPTINRLGGILKYQSRKWR
jgi:hypothetical protein